jgi:FG-GAP-like repeat/FG-GAP repeat
MLTTDTCSQGRATSKGQNIQLPQTSITLGQEGSLPNAPITVTSDCNGSTIGSLVVLPSGSGNTFEVEVVTGVTIPVSQCTEGNKGCIVERRILAFVDHTPLQLPIAMLADCEGVVCPASATCSNGTCVNAMTQCPSGMCALGDGGVSDAAPDATDATMDAGGDVTNAGDANEAGPMVHAPRPMSPLSTSRVTSRTPMLSWQLPTDVPAAIVDLCRDAKCKTIFHTSGPISGTHALAYPTPLSPGVWFWRLHPSTDPSAGDLIWNFTVGTRSATGGPNTSWGTTLDVNGDGYPDLAIGAPGQTGSPTGAVYIYFGQSGGGFGAMPQVLRSPPEARSFGASVASAGDVNGDGYADLIVGAPSSVDGAVMNVGSAYLYLGGGPKTGKLVLPPTPLNLPPGVGVASYFGTSVASAGDVNCDGYADVIIGAPGVESGNGAAYVYLGGASGFASTKASMLPAIAAGSSGFGTSVAGIGDEDGDGCGDVVVGAPLDGTGSAYVYLGGVAFSGTPIPLPTGGADGGLPVGSLFGSAVAGVGDVNGDGYADLIVGAKTAQDGVGAALLYLGNKLSAAPTVLTGSGGDFGAAVAGAGDVNGDGYADFLVGQPGGAGNGTTYLYFGGTSASGGGKQIATDGTRDPGSAFGTSVTSTGIGFDGGLSGFVVGGPDFLNSRGAAYIYAASDAGTVTSATHTLAPPGDGGSQLFGFSVFGATN